MDANDIALFMTPYVEWNTQESPSGEWVPMTEDEASQRFLDFLDAARAEAWAEGAEMGHRLYAENLYFVNQRNPYTKDAR